MGSRATKYPEGSCIIVHCDFAGTRMTGHGYILTVGLFLAAFGTATIFVEVEVTS